MGQTDEGIGDSDRETRQGNAIIWIFDYIIMEETRHSSE